MKEILIFAVCCHANKFINSLLKRIPVEILDASKYDLAFLFGMFNYGRRGILDLDHTRLFTFTSLKRLVQSHGCEVLEMKGIPVPFPFVMGNIRLARLILNINRALIFLSKKLFSYQIAMTVRPKPTLKQLPSDARSKREMLLVQLAKDGKSS
jgi:hypothetical protein